MKLQTLTIALFFFFHINAQTNIIANKSHSGDLTDLSNESDDFGIPDNYIKFNVDTVILYKNKCFIEVRKNMLTENKITYQRDTICSTYNFPRNKDEFLSFKMRYPKKTIFIGFEKIKRKKVERKTSNQNGQIHLLFSIVTLLVLLYSFLPLLKKYKS